MKKKILIVFGTRPEAIKFAPVIRELSNSFELQICSTGQHRELLDQVIELFGIKIDFDLNIMSSGQDLFSVTTNIITKIKDVLDDTQPDLVMVHGDTTTCMAASLASFYSKIDVAHLEAGLRTNDIYSPFPEELNRQITSLISKIHFAPTELSKLKLVEENIPEENIYVVGNSVIDSLLMVLPLARERKFSKEILMNLPFLKDADKSSGRIIVVTGHRRENFGKGIREICMALKEIAKEEPQVKIIFSVHLNPNITIPVRDILGDVKNIFLIEPLDYLYFIKLLDLSHLILTDSGGIQEEAPSLGKPVIIMRDKTERQEGIDAGTVFLEGSSRDSIISKTLELLRDEDLYLKVSNTSNPYGDGTTAIQVKNHLKNLL